MKCIIGLGNIGKEYMNTRHNTGFMCLDYLCKKYNVNIDKKLNKCVYGETNVTKEDGGCEKVIFVKPTTYMNLSGEATLEVMQWFKLKPCDILLIYDDIDLPQGEVRYRLKGSSGTHNGVRNIISILQTEEIARIRVGIESRDENTKIDLASFVLGKYTIEEIQKIERNTYVQVVKHYDEFLKKNASNKF